MSLSTFWMPFGMIRPNSAAKPRMVFASMVFCLTSSDLAVCSASVPCCSRVLIGTNFASGRTAAVQIAAASAASFFLPFLTNGLTASGGISFTSWPRPVSVRPMMGCTACFHHHCACFLLFEKRDQVVPSDLVPDHRLSGTVYAVNLEHGLRRIDTDHNDAHRKRTLSDGLQRPVYGASMPGAVHPT